MLVELSSIARAPISKPTPEWVEATRILRELGVSENDPIYLDQLILTTSRLMDSKRKDVDNVEA